MTPCGLVGLWNILEAHTYIASIFRAENGIGLHNFFSSVITGTGT
jgi:hypothetical protein